MEFRTIELVLRGSVAHLTLNRPERLNAITAPMLTELIAACRILDDDPEVRVVIVGGSGSSFCAGYDLDAFDAITGDPVERRIQANLGGRAASALERLRAVTVSRLHGWVVGGGVVLAAATDLRVAASDARFKIPEVELGIPLNWAGIPRLVREIGPALTKELVMTCREFSAGEARSAGMVNRVVAAELLDTEVEELVASLVAKPAVPLIATKEQVNAVAAAQTARIGYEMDGDGFLAVTMSPEFGEAFRAYREALEERDG